LRPIDDNHKREQDWKVLYNKRNGTIRQKGYGYLCKEVTREPRAAKEDDIVFSSTCSRFPVAMSNM